MMNQLNKNLIHTPCTLQLGTVMMTVILNPCLFHCHHNIREHSVLRATIIINYVLYLYRYVSCVQMCKCANVSELVTEEEGLCQRCELPFDRIGISKLLI